MGIPTGTSAGSIFLIGMMCSGKSTVGRALAPLLSLPFIDLDRMVEAEVGPLLPFVKQEGEEAFRRLETQALLRAVAGADAVIATGGGTPCFGGNLRVMRERGTIVLLDPPFDALMKRIRRAGGDRPLLHGLSGDALDLRVKELLAERRECYAGAHFVVGTDEPAAIIATQIAAALRDHAR